MTAANDSTRGQCQTAACLNQLWQSLAPQRPSRPAVPSLPRTSASRLAQAAAAAAASSSSSADAEKNDAAAATVLYLAYGSNLSAETFVGNRGIQPLSAVNVSAPALDLVFDLPGIPYLEPCFANSAPRKLPKVPLPTPPPGAPPIELPPGVPSKPPGGSGDVFWGRAEEKRQAEEEPAATTLPVVGGPTWTKGLYGVVYEVTREDYATIVRTEGGGASYLDILTPCVELPPAVRIPEKPTIPEPPRPFLVHTLFAPRLPDVPDDEDDNDDDDKTDDPEKNRPGRRAAAAAAAGGGGIRAGREEEEEEHEEDPGNPPPDDGDEPPRLPRPPPVDDDTKRWWRRWARRLAAPVRRPEADYAQPSLRYLRLIRDGAAEHFMPQDYQTYLARLEQYTITQQRQRAGRFVFSLLWLPLLLLVIGLSKVLANDAGRIPTWLGVTMNVVANLMWLSYDVVFKKHFGDGERTMEETDQQRAQRAQRERYKSWSASHGGEKNRLLADW